MLRETTRIDINSVSAHGGSGVLIGVEPEDGRTAHYWRMRAQAQPSCRNSQKVTQIYTLPQVSQNKLFIINYLLGLKIPYCAGSDA